MIRLTPLDDTAAAAASTTWHYSCLLGSEIVRALGDVFDGEDTESLLYRAGFSMEMVAGGGSNPHALSGNTAQGTAGDGDDSSPRCEGCGGK